MSRARRRALLPLLALAAAGVLACGGSDDDDEPQSAANTATTEAAAPPAESEDPPAEAPVEEDEPERGRGRGTDREEKRAPVDTSKPEAGIAAPARVDPSGREAAREIERTQGTHTRRREGQVERTVIGATCARGACTLRIRVHAEGTGTNVLAQAPVISKLFDDRSVDSVTILIHHHTPGNKEPETTPFLTMRCRRSDGRSWDDLDASDLDRQCRISRPPGGADKGPRERGRGNR